MERAEEQRGTARAAWSAAWRRGLAELAAGAAGALFPRLCWLCARPAVDGYGCGEHALLGARLAPSEARCAGCLERLPAGLARGLCARCRREPRGYRRLVVAGEYRAGSPLGAWILALKHGGRRELAVPLGVLAAEAWRAVEAEPRGRRLVPVPLHPLRRLERGHDQARELARVIARETGAELVPALARVRWTVPQGSPGARSRASNVQGAFRVRAAALPRVAGAELWLVDDVVTSGATVRACAEALRAAGARSVAVLAVARVPRTEEEPDAATLPDA